MAAGNRRKNIVITDDDGKSAPIDIGLPTDDAGTIIVDPGSFDSTGGGEREASGGDGSDSGGNQPRRRGRKPGSKNASKTPSLDLSAFAGILVLAHSYGPEELHMDRPTAEEIAKRTGDVLRWYNIKATQKAMDHVAFAMAVGAFYLPRVSAVAARKRREANQLTPQVEIMPAARPAPQQRQSARQPTHDPVMMTDGTLVVSDGNTRH